MTEDDKKIIRAPSASINFGSSYVTEITSCGNEKIACAVSTGARNCNVSMIAERGGQLVEVMSSAESGSHKGLVTKLITNNQGPTLCSIGRDGCGHIYDTRTTLKYPEIVVKLTSVGDKLVNDADCFDGDLYNDHLLALGDRAGIEVFDLRKVGDGCKSVLASQHHITDVVNTCSFLPNGHVISSCDGGMVNVYDMEKGLATRDEEGFDEGIISSVRMESSPKEVRLLPEKYSNFAQLAVMSFLGEVQLWRLDGIATNSSCNVDFSTAAIMDHSREPFLNHPVWNNQESRAQAVSLLMSHSDDLNLYAMFQSQGKLVSFELLLDNFWYDRAFCVSEDPDATILTAQEVSKGVLAVGTDHGELTIWKYSD